MKKRKITVAVAVGSGVSVARGVGVRTVGVSVGMAAEVWVEAALAVCTIIVPIALGSMVGTDGAARVGTHATTVTNAVSQNRYRFLGIAIFPLTCPNDPPNQLRAFSTITLNDGYFSTMIRTYG